VESWAECGPLDGSGRRTNNAEEGIQRREDRVRVTGAEAGKKVGEICREMGVSPQAFYGWKRKYAGLAMNELRELRQLREENRKLKTLVADLTLDKYILQDILSKKSEAHSATSTGEWHTPAILSE
jgi:putative transposase